MKFVIEPAQTFWVPSDLEHHVLNSTLTVPRGAEILGIELNNILVRFTVCVPTEAERTKLEFVAIRIGAGVESTVLVGHTEFVGMLRMGAGLDQYAVFLQNAQPAFDIERAIKLCVTDVLASEPERLTKIMAGELDRMLARRVAVPAAEAGPDETAGREPPV